MKSGIELIEEERKRQIDAEGWNKFHDDDHGNMELTGAACSYAANAINKHYNENKVRFQINLPAETNLQAGNTGDRGDRQLRKAGWYDGWPWDGEWDKRKKHDKLRSLVIAGALIAAEIDRLQLVKQ